MKLSQARFYVLVILISVVPLSLIFNILPHHKTQYPKIENGVLDLTNWDFKKDGIVGLDGKWEFYWGKLLSYEDFNEKKEIKPDMYAELPSVWTNYKLNGKTLPGKGFATYRLKVKTNDVNALKGLKLLNQSTAYKLMINDEIIAENGKVGETEEETVPEYRPQTVSFKNNNKEFEIIIQVSNFVYSRGGIWYSTYLGNDQDIRQLREFGLEKVSFVFGAVMIMAIYQAAMYLLQKRKKSAMYLALMLLIIGVRILVTGEYLINSVLPNVNIFETVPIEYMVMFLGQIMWALFVHEVYPEEMPKKAIKIIVSTGVIFSAFIILTPISIFTKYLIFYEVIMAYIYIYVVFSVFKAVLKKREGAYILFLAAILLIIVFIIDILYQWNIIHNKYGTNFEFAGLVVIFIQSYILSEQFSLAFEKVEKLSEKLIILDKFKDEFLANTSHELRTPLNGIINITQAVLKDNTGAINSKQKANLRIVLASAKRLYNLINDILDISSLKLNEIKLNPKPVDVRILADKVIFVLEHLKGDKDVIFKNLINPDIPLVFFDEDRLCQIFYNLLGNALKFTEKGEIVISSELANGVVTIFIKDAGIGIEEKNLENIFKYFEQVDSDINRRHEGTGIGLFVTKQFIELQGGTVGVKSKYGEGSCFYFTLLIAEEKSEKNIVKFDSNFTIEEYPIDQTHNNQRDNYDILAIEDDPVNIKALTDNLRLYGYTVKGVQNGYSALEVLEHGIKFDVIILDIMLPDMSGFDVLKKVREKYLPVELPVMILTSLNGIRDIETGFKLGANDYLVKPFESGELNVRIRNLIHMKNAVTKLVSLELEFLQAQIKPHFIYNALSVIVSLSVSEPEKSRELVLNLSNYLRSSFDFERREGLTTLKKELGLVEAYLSIEKARFKERINIKYEIDSIDYMVPMLCIQPLVENAVKHGIMPLLEGGTIVISVRKRNNYLTISVEDNGVGIDEEKIKNILSGQVKRGSVGIKNINRRLMVLYGQGIKIEGKKNRWTKVEFVIPCEENRGNS